MASAQLMVNSRWKRQRKELMIESLISRREKMQKTMYGLTIPKQCSRILIRTLKERVLITSRIQTENISSKKLQRFQKDNGEGYVDYVWPKAEGEKTLA